MKTSTFGTLLVLALGSSASPVEKRDLVPTDTQVLQYALTLEHLENAFYSGALAKYSQSAFVNAGLPVWARKRYVQIGEHEAAHVAFLTAALGEQAPKPCTYKFPYNDPKSFAALSMILEGVGVSAYLGAAQFISNKEYLTDAGSILTTESRHAAWISSAVNKHAAWSGALDIPLTLRQVYSLAAPFFVSCPAGNPTFLTPYPALTLETTSYKAGSQVTFEFDDSKVMGKPLFLAIFSGLSKTFVPISNKKATLPSDLTGTAYGVVTSDGAVVNDDTTVAGVAIFFIADN